MASSSGQPGSSKAPNYDVFVGPPRHIDRVRTALEIYMEKVQGMRTAKSKLLSCLVDMCPKHWKIHPELRTYIEDQSTLWSLAVSDLRPLFKRLKVYKELTQTAQLSLDEFKKRLEEVQVMTAEYELMKTSPNCSKNQLMQIEYMVRESNRALSAIRTTVEEQLLDFRQTQTEIGRDLLLMFEEIQRVTCSESLQVIDMIEDRLKAVPAKKRNRKGQTVEDLEFILKLVQAEVDKVKAKPVDLGSRIEQYNNMKHSYSDEWEVPDEQSHQSFSNKGHGSVPFSTYDTESISSQSRPSSRGSTIGKDQGHYQYRLPIENISSYGNQSFDSQKQINTSRGQDSRQGQKVFQNPYRYSEGSSSDNVNPVSRITRSKTTTPYNEYHESLDSGRRSSTDGFFSSTPFSNSRSNVVEHVQAPQSNIGKGQGQDRATPTSRAATPTGVTEKNVRHSYQDQRRTSRPSTPDDQGRQTKRYMDQGHERRSSRPSTPSDQDRRGSRPTTPASGKSRPSSRQGRESKKSSRDSGRTSQRQPCFSNNGKQCQGRQRNMKSDESEDDIFFSPSKVRVSETPRGKRPRQPFKSFNFLENAGEEVGDDFHDCD